MRGVNLSRADSSEGHAICEMERQSRAGSGDLLGIGIDGENACSRVRVTNRQPPVTATEFEHAEAFKRDKLGKRIGLDTLGVDPLGHPRIMANAAGGSRPRPPATGFRLMLAVPGVVNAR